MKKLKCLRLFRCMFSETQFEAICETIKYLMANVRLITLYDPTLIEDEREMSVSHILSLIQSFESLKVIEVIIQNEISIFQLWQQNDDNSMIFPSNLEKLLLWQVIYTDPIQYISEDLFRNMNVSHLKNLYISEYYISEQTLKTIIKDMNLKRFGFSCPELNLSVLKDLADKHKQLIHLVIDSTSAKCLHNLFHIIYRK